MAKYKKQWNVPRDKNDKSKCQEAKKPDMGKYVEAKKPDKTKLRGKKNPKNKT